MIDYEGLQPVTSRHGEMYKDDAHRAITHQFMQDILELRHELGLTIVSDDEPVMLSKVSTLCNIGAHMQMISSAVQLQHSIDQEMQAQGFMDSDMKKYLLRIAPLVVLGIIAVAAFYFYAK